MRRATNDDSGLFSPTVLGFLIASVVAIFALSTVLATFDRETPPFRASILSPSAIGHKGLYALLEKLNLPIAKSRINARIWPGKGGLLVVAEPDQNLFSFDDESDLGHAPDALLVLPKWTAKADLRHDGWVREVKPLGIEHAQKVLSEIDPKARMICASAPRTWTRNLLPTSPQLDGEIQLFTSASLRPIVGSDADILVGEYSTRHQRIWVLADPDLIENHGITKGDNARFVLDLVNGLRRGDGPIVFDETVHGAVAPERNWIQLLFQFPFVIVTVQVIAALGLLLLATTARFGGAEEPPPPFSLGKARLIDNIAALMDRAGHQANILRRYLSVKLAETGRALHAPAGLDDAALARWLDHVGEARGVTSKSSDILAASAAIRGGRARALPHLFDEARDMYRWNKDMTDGTSRRQDDR